MGKKYEVHSWVIMEGHHLFVIKYSGNSLLAALWVMWREKRRGVGCVQLEWR